MSARALPAAVPCARRRPAAPVIESAFVRLRPVLPWIHAVMAVVFLGIIVVPALLPAPAGDATPLTDFPTLAGWLLWGMWFPLVFLSVIVTGRSWCGLLCPMGAASEWANRLGRQRAIPGWLRWEGTPVVSFLIVTILGQTLGVRDYAGAALEVFGGTMLAAIAIGWLYGRRKRAWCRHACPIGLLLGVFSRLGAVDFAPRRRAAGGTRQTEAGICPTMIDVARKDESRHCIECFRCVNPAARGGIHLELRRPGAEIEAIRDHNPNPAEAWFLFLGTGVALGGFLWPVLPQVQDWRQAVGEWAVAHGWMGLLEPGPAWLMSDHPLRHEVFLWLDFALICGTMLATMAVLAAVLAGLTAAAASLARRAGGDASLGQGFTELAYQVAPVAMVSLVIGLGGKLFEPLALTPLGPAGIHAVKGGMLGLALLWSLWLGWRILARQGVAPRLRWLPLLPGLLGSAVVGLGWWPAIFGL